MVWQGNTLPMSCYIYRKTIMSMLRSHAGNLRTLWPSGRCNFSFLRCFQSVGVVIFMYERLVEWGVICGLGELNPAAS